jgi:hypothetical protein
MSTKNIVFNDLTCRWAKHNRKEGVESVCRSVGFVRLSSELSGATASKHVELGTVSIYCRRERDGKRTARVQPHFLVGAW